MTASADRDALVMALLRGVRAFGDAQDRMNVSLKGDMDMNASDLATLRLLIIREEQGAAIGPAEIARHLHISTASTSKLLDRLEASGHVARAPHPTDRRARVIVLTEEARAAFWRLFGARLLAMRDAAQAFTDDELAAATRVIAAMSVALDPESAQ